MKGLLVDRKHLLVSWRPREYGPRPGGRVLAVYRNRKPSNFYVQIGRLEFVVWYR